MQGQNNSQTWNCAKFAALTASSALTRHEYWKINALALNITRSKKQLTFSGFNDSFFIHFSRTQINRRTSKIGQKGCVNCIDLKSLSGIRLNTSICPECFFFFRFFFCLPRIENTRFVLFIVRKKPMPLHHIGITKRPCLWNVYDVAQQTRQFHYCSYKARDVSRLRKFKPNTVNGRTNKTTTDKR